MKTIGSRRHRPERGQSAERGSRPERGRIAEMYERYYNRLMVIACSYTGERAAAEDLVQEAFLKAILSYRAEGPPFDHPQRRQNHRHRTGSDRRARHSPGVDG